MNVLARGGYALTVCAAIAVLAGCGGASGGGSTIGSTILPSPQHVAAPGYSPPVRASKPRTVVVVVLNKSKKPYPGVGVALGWRQGGTEFHYAGVTGPQGKFRFDGVPTAKVSKGCWVAKIGKLEDFKCVENKPIPRRPTPFIL